MCRSSRAQFASVAASAASKEQMNHLIGLSSEQLEAVMAPLQATRVIAGPGSGKTRVLTARVAHLIHHHKAAPWQIVAITFTNKAASEMRERLAAALGADVAKDIFAGTFHSFCYLVLRRSLHLLPGCGRAEGWTLYDADDSMAVLVKLVRGAHPDWKAADVREKAKNFQGRISRMKNGLGTWLGLSGADAVAVFHQLQTGGVEMTPGQQASAQELAEWFDTYEEALRGANALDFDDLLGCTVALLRSDQELRMKLRRRFRHVLVDEFQDTNSPQYELVRLLATATSSSEGQGRAGEQHDVLVVGDPDQAIYGWRGADVTNMRDRFAVDFPDSNVYRLRDNYRSTARILTAAQAVIANSLGGAAERLALRALRDSGPTIKIYSLQDAWEEAEHIAEETAALLRAGECRDRDIAVLFRTHMQARLVEQQLVSVRALIKPPKQSISAAARKI